MIFFLLDKISHTVYSRFMRIQSPRPLPSAFSRIELACLVGTLSALALLRIGAENYSARKSSTAVCVYNVRQLTRAWQIYAEDHEGSLVLNFDDSRLSWAKAITFDPEVNASLTHVTNTIFGPYVGRPELYRCPEDRGVIDTRTKAVSPRTRSYSMNSAVGVDRATWLPSPKFRTYTNLAGITDPTPAMLSIFLEEHQNSINDGSFGFIMPLSPEDTQLMDFPATNHDYSMTHSYADGHVEMKHWVDSRTIMTSQIPTRKMPNNPDVLWLAPRISSLTKK